MIWLHSLPDLPKPIRIRKMCHTLSPAPHFPSLETRRWRSTLPPRDQVADARSHCPQNSSPCVGAFVLMFIGLVLFVAIFRFLNANPSEFLLGHSAYVRNGFLSASFDLSWIRLLGKGNAAVVFQVARPTFDPLKAQLLTQGKVSDRNCDITHYPLLRYSYAFPRRQLANWTNDVDSLLAGHLKKILPILHDPQHQLNRLVQVFDFWIEEYPLHHLDSFTGKFVCRVHAVGFLLMELCRGSLSDVLARRELSTDDAFGVAHAVVAALRDLHHSRMSHGDITSDNFLVVGKKFGPRFVLLNDPGLSSSSSWRSVEDPFQHDLDGISALLESLLLPIASRELVKAVLQPLAASPTNLPLVSWNQSVERLKQVESVLRKKARENGFIGVHVQDQTLRGEFAELHKRIDSQDEEIKTLQSVIASQQEEIESLQTTVRNQDGVIASQQEEIESLQTTVRNQDGVIASQQEEIESLQTTVRNQDGVIASQQEEIESLQTTVRNQDGVIASQQEEIESLQTTVKSLEEIIVGLELRLSQLENQPKYCE